LDFKHFLELEKKRKREAGKVYLPCWASKEMKRRFEEIALQEGLSLSAVLRAALLASLKELEAEENENVPAA
jgi:hypothetical protein